LTLPLKKTTIIIIEAMAPAVLTTHFNGTFHHATAPELAHAPA
jgi:hypothetical protein